MLNSKLKVVSKYNIQNFHISSARAREGHKDRRKARAKNYIYIFNTGRDAAIFHKFDPLCYEVKLTATQEEIAC